MTIIIRDTFKFALSCRETISLKKGQEIKLGDLELKQFHLDRIVAIGRGKVMSSKTLVKKVKEIKPVVDLETANIKQEDLVIKEVTEKEAEEEVEIPEHYKIELKPELEAFAKKKYGINLDRRKSLKTMQKIIDEHITDM